MAVKYSDERVKKFTAVAMQELNWKDVLLQDGIKEYRDLGDHYELSCPFHEDYTPSLHVSLKLQLYHCFSCGRKGTILYYVYQRSGSSLSFRAFCESLLKSSIRLQDRCGFNTLKITTSEIESNFTGRRKFSRQKAVTDDMSLGTLQEKVVRLGKTWPNLVMSLTLLQEGMRTDDIYTAVERVSKGNKGRERVSLLDIMEDGEDKEE